MNMEIDATDYKISPSIQVPNKNNRIIHEFKIMEKNSQDTIQLNDTSMPNNIGSSNYHSQQNTSRSEKRKNMNDYELWKYSYSLVKNGCSILAPEPSQRSRSYRDLILQEMNWMAVDYYQERRWKSHIAREISNSINTSIIDRKRLKRDWPSKQCSYNIELFWLKLKENNDASGISNSLQEYCLRVVTGKHLKFNMPEIVDETPTKRNDLLAITVPVYKNPNNNSVNVAKSEVVTATLNHMLVLGAELYPQFHRPPDDEIDVFTLPALNPKHEFDYNILLLLLHSLKGNMFTKITKAELKSLLSNVGTYKTHHSPPGLSSILPIRRIPRDEIDPFSLSVNYRDFLDNTPIHPLNIQKLVLKWEDPSLNYSDFELLDSWMLESKCWPIISIALNLRSSSGGLLRREFNPKACRDAFYKVKKTPRGLVNSSKKLLGPKQTKTILSFIDPPPPIFDFKLIVPPQTSKNQSDLKYDEPTTSTKTLFGDVSRLYREESKIYSTSNKKENFYSILKSAADSKSDKKLLLKQLKSESADSLVVPNNLKLELLSNDPGLNLPVGLEEFMNFDGDMDMFDKRTSDSIDDDEDSSISATRNTFVRLSKSEFGVNHRFSSLNSVVTLATSLNSHDNVVRNLGYSELSTRMNKQLRIGFLGIPTKMFVYSLFYCGRIKPDFRVRKVALSISSISKFIPPPHLLYSKMFDPDINLILTKSRAMSFDKQRSKSLDSQDSFTNELVQNYSNEVNSYLKSKCDENNLPTLLATYAHVSLSRGNACNQSCFSSKKILIVASNYASSANTTNSSSTPTERKRAQINSFESTPRHRTRQIVEIPLQPENVPSYRPVPEPVIRRQIAHAPSMMQIHPYQHQHQQMQHMMYGMNSSMNQQMPNMNQQMGPMNSMGQPGNSMSQPMKSMNNLNMMGMGQHMNNIGGMNNMGMSQNMGNKNNINQSMPNMNQQMGNMSQQMPNLNQHMGSMPPMNQSMPNMNQQMNSMPNMNLPMNNMNNMSQPMNKMNTMNPLMNGKMMYNLHNAPMQHFPEDESYQYRYDQRSRHT